LEVRVGWHHDHNGNSSYFGRVWEDGDEERELVDVGCAFVDPISSVDELRERMGDYAAFLPVDLAIPHDHKTVIRFVRVAEGNSPRMRDYVATPEFA
jgi:hypothetical protein